MHGVPEILNTAQGSQLASEVYNDNNMDRHHNSPDAEGVP